MGESTEGIYTILHFVRYLVVSLRIRIPSHAFNPSKYATDTSFPEVGICLQNIEKVVFASYIDYT